MCLCLIHFLAKENSWQNPDMEKNHVKPAFNNFYKTFAKFPTKFCSLDAGRDMCWDHDKAHMSQKLPGVVSELSVSQ